MVEFVVVRQGPEQGSLRGLIHTIEPTDLGGKHRVAEGQGSGEGWSSKEM